MTRVGIPAALLVLTSTICSAQTAPGSITGIVRDPDGVVPTAIVEAASVAGGTPVTATSGADGRYTLGPLPAGTYVVSVQPIGLRTMRFTRPGVLVASGQATELDIALNRGNQGVLGDDNGYLGIRTKYAGLTGALPHTAD